MVNVELTLVNNVSISTPQATKLLTSLTDNIGLHLKTVSVSRNKISAKFGNASVDILTKQINKKLGTDFSKDSSVKGLFSNHIDSGLKLSYLEIEKKKVEV